MTKFQKSARRKARQIDPKTLKKRSQVAQKRASSLIITGQREPTDTGYIIPGHKGKVLETFCEVLVAGTSSALLRHPKKDRVVRVLDGDGFVVLQTDDANVEKRIYPGDEIALKAGTTFRFATTSDQQLQLHVSQESKYDARLEVLEKPGATAKITPELLEEAQRVEAAPLTRRGSKAKQQQLEASGQRIVPSQIISAEGVDVGATNHVQEVMNARPSHGRFDEEGAG